MATLKYLISFRKDEFTQALDSQRYTKRGFIIIDIDVSQSGETLEDIIRKEIRAQFFENDERDFGISLIHKLSD